MYAIDDTSVVGSNMSRPFAGSSVPMFGPAVVAALYAFCGW